MTTVFVAAPGMRLSVDADARTIEGLAVPWDVGAVTAGGQLYRFARGGARFADVGRVKLLRDHEPSRAVGKAVSIVDTPEGLFARFKVARGAAGDEALTLAADGVIDGLSVGVDFKSGDVAHDPHDSHVLRVTGFNLREVSLTPLPAFDDARVTGVTMSREGAEMPEETQTQVPVTFTLEQLAALKEMFGREPQQPPERRATVDPTRRPLPGAEGGAVFTRPEHPLELTTEALGALADAVDARAKARFVAADPHAKFATLTTTTIGAPRAWASNVLPPPRLLHLVGGVPRTSMDAVMAQFPQLTLPTATTSVGEGASILEYAASAAGSVTAGRFGRWTDLSGESQVGTDTQTSAARSSTGNTGSAFSIWSRCFLTQSCSRSRNSSNDLPSRRLR